MDFQSIAKRLLSNEVMKQTSWSEDTLSMWLRDGCKCVYCKRNMLDSYDVAYYAESRDHLLPVTIYKELEKTDWNLVLACRTCNGLKATYDPNDDSTYVKGSQLLAPEDRERLIKKVADEVKRKRDARERLFQKERTLILAALENAAAAARR